MLTINLSELILTVVNFFLLLFLLKRFLYTPLLAFMDARKARIETGLEQEASAAAALAEERLRNEKRLKESRDQAKQILRDGHRADEAKYAELLAKIGAEAAHSRRETRAEELQRNQQELQQVETEESQLAAMLAANLLDHFPDMPEILVGNGLRLAVERAETTWESNLHENREGSEKESAKTTDLFGFVDSAELDSEELQKRKEEQRQLHERWEELAAMLAERLVVPGA